MTAGVEVPGQPEHCGSDELVPAVLRAVVHRYETGVLPAVPGCEQLSATDVVKVCTALLQAANLEVFELALWHSWGGRVGELNGRVDVGGDGNE